MIKDILKKYWGFSSFRPLQEEIIQSVMDGKDTLGLLPTGGGKSICFQVPAMAQDGLCLVISPLIALMKDQVENLEKRGIKGYRISSDLRMREIDIILDNCAYGDVKFLYVSPERLTTPIFLERIKKMSINLIAVDEAHCISQWGYDFRPPYLQIAELRKVIDAPYLALTATATIEVVKDIQEKLKFKTKNVFQGSYHRSNLAYVVLKEENKYKKLLEVCSNVKGTGIVYAATRKRTKEISDFLHQNNIVAEYFHAGLQINSKNKRQEDWMSGKIRVIVATNAFGMGIDKPDVRFVVHMDIPNNPESYFQEAGRGGRDGNKSYAVLVYNKQDLLDLEYRVKAKYPPLKDVRKIYRALANHLQIAIGSGQETMHNFILTEFTNKYQFKTIEAYNALKLLESGGYITLSDSFYNPSRLMVVMDRKSLYSFQVKINELQEILKLILRNYDGVFDVFTKIDERDIARKLNSSSQKVKKELKLLHKLHVIHYIPQNNLPKLFFIHERLLEDSLVFHKNIYLDRMKKDVIRKDAILSYVTSSKCRSKMLLEYFGEIDSSYCGCCDVCLERKKLELVDKDIEQIEARIRKAIGSNAVSIEDIKMKLKEIPPDHVMKVLRWMIDVDELQRDDEGAIYIVKTGS